MEERKFRERELDSLEAGIRELQIRYDQYFAGVEKREPLKERQTIAQDLRRFVNRRIVQTDLRFRYQSLATRFHTYARYWDRILRLIDEGRYLRQTNKRTPLPVSRAKNAQCSEEVEQVYREIIKVQRTGNLVGEIPDRRKLASFLDKQKEKIREKFGDREVEFRVVTEGGKPRIKVRARS
jgi:hypothetical protein